MSKILFSTAIAISLLAPAAIALPVPNQAGDYTNTRRGNGHRDWKVIDPDPTGLNCRMAKQFQGIAMDAVNTPDELLSRDYKPNINTWKVIRRFRPGQRLSAVTGNGMNQHLQFDDRGKPWMAVRVSTLGNVIVDCFVRANRRLIQPL